jgi:NAD(P)-dependent dehydrogenase (short-subunit alcohol dehydrogenase family)
MARILVTGSSDGLGRLAAQRLVKQGHSVVLHARNEKRAHDAMAAVPNAEHCLIADLSSVEQAKQMAADANKLGHFDAVIHNVALGPSERDPQWTPEGFASTFAVNSLAPYIITCLMQRPARLIYLSSSLHRSGNATMDPELMTWKSHSFQGYQAYNDSKLHNVLLANAVARRWRDVRSNSVDPGWMPTK